MKADQFATKILLPGAAFTESVLGIRSSEQALHQIMTTAGQESGFNWRYQLARQGGPTAPPGPARGWWQFELGDARTRGGVTGLWIHQKSGPWLRKLCEELGVYPDPVTIHRAIEGNDLLAYALARINYVVNDPKDFPTTPDAGWQCYLNVWRPGEPHPGTWRGHWDASARALAFIGG